jgi:phage gpG-like protein
VNLRQFGEALGRLSDEGLRQAAVGTAKAVKGIVEAEAKINLSGRVLHSRTGRLKGTIQGAVEVKGDTVEAIARVGGGGVGTVPYASIHENGGVIRPKRGRFLAIPMGPALRGGKEGGAGMWPRDIPGLKFVPIKGGAQGMLVQRMTSGKGKKAREEWVPWFHLVRSVTMPRRPYLAPASDIGRQAVAPQFGIHLRKALGELA